MQKLDPSVLQPVNRQSFTPLYQQIAAEIESHLQELPVGAMLPSETEIVAHFHVSRGVAVQALKELLNKRVVVRMQGSGTFKAPAAPFPARFTRSLNAAKLPSFSDDLRQAHYEVGERIYACELIKAPEDVRQALKLANEDRVWKLSRTILASGVPVVYLTSYVLESVYPEVNAEEVAKHSFYGYLEAHYGLALRPAWAEEEYSAVSVPEGLAQILQVEDGSPLLFSMRVGYLADGRPAEYVLSYMRGDLYHVRATVLPDCEPTTIGRIELEERP
jgi:DNA-binding GntR family transcriptional regulator